MRQDWEETLCEKPRIELGQRPRPDSPADRVEEELGTVEFHDGRLTRRLFSMVRDFYGKPLVPIPRALSGSHAKTKAAYRFLGNERVSMDEIPRAHVESTIEQIKEHRVVLAVQDTSSLNYTTHRATEGLGPISTSKDPSVGMLLTTFPTANLEQACERMAWYARRWGIEVYHRTLMSGCRIEDRQLETVEGLQSCLALDLVVAWRIYHLTILGREVPDPPCTIFFERADWKALYIGGDNAGNEVEVAIDEFAEPAVVVHRAGPGAAGDVKLKTGNTEGILCTSTSSSAMQPRSAEAGTIWCFCAHIIASPARS